MTKHWFITGISRGLGLALAQAALARGDTVIGTVRSGAPSIEVGPGELHVLTLDVTDGVAIERVVAEAFRRAEGRLDVVVNNAGYGLLGALEDAGDEEAQRLFATDVFGPFKVIRAALPGLRAQGEARILNITSIAGRAPGAASALYAAAKHALEGLTASLHQEVEPLGIKLTAVAPGAFRTDFLSMHSIRLSTPKAGGYDATVGRASQVFSSMAGQQLGDPARAADALLRIVDAPDPPLHLLLGSDALRRARAKLAAVEAEIATWEDLTISTDFPEA
ncbi:SDR family NAD(P)-dependent oxidoreductase [Caulobacter sp. RL271]|jgi:NAD(P)-dependent dehydrogenase (short-subunit alcohol dehydrogenase family)|uniref:SDR family NAD(P)-dependent oxidoreductase n=1 Tax=Caulobacter segnis TaxID=88688 RepID=A0ABY4ZTQ6_9CAUL|nr:SDR family NAD(P)-dependent oxidoreductase [Caulobacter segnis]USQ95382.1 SDR family NAD(P)-dependent oxidoreductase [Caulobacter segnis]